MVLDASIEKKLMYQKQRMLELVDKKKALFGRTFRDYIDYDVKELKNMGQLEYNFNNMIKDIKTNRDTELNWLHELINKTINDKKVVHQREEATKKLLFSQVNFLKQKIKAEVESRKVTDDDIQAALDKYKELIQQKVLEKRNDIRNTDDAAN